MIVCNQLINPGTIDLVTRWRYRKPLRDLISNLEQYSDLLGAIVVRQVYTAFGTCKGEEEVSNECDKASGRPLKVTSESQAAMETKKVVTGKRSPEKLRCGSGSRSVRGVDGASRFLESFSSSGHDFRGGVDEAS